MMMLLIVSLHCIAWNFAVSWCPSSNVTSWYMIVFYIYFSSNHPWSPFVAIVWNSYGNRLQSAWTSGCTGDCWRPSCFQSMAESYWWKRCRFGYLEKKNCHGIPPFDGLFDFLLLPSSDSNLFFVAYVLPCRFKILTPWTKNYTWEHSKHTINSTFNLVEIGFSVETSASPFLVMAATSSLLFS